MVQALAEGSFAAALAEIINQYEWLELMLQVADSQSISDRVRQADVDFGLILDPEGQAGLNVLAFIEMEVGVVLHPHHPFAAAPAISLGNLAMNGILFPARR